MYVFIISMRYLGSVCGRPLPCGVGGGGMGVDAAYHAMGNINIQSRIACE